MKRLALAGFMSVIPLINPQEVWAEGFNNKDFLKMPPIRQKFWLNGAMDTLAHVASFKDKTIGQCVVDWYFGEKHAQRNGLIFASMEKYPDHTPTVIIVALTQRACGVYLKVD